MIPWIILFTPKCKNVREKNFEKRCFLLQNGGEKPGEILLAKI
jgi:hypothetical protein